MSTDWDSTRCRNYRDHQTHCFLKKYWELKIKVLTTKVVGFVPELAVANSNSLARVFLVTSTATTPDELADLPKAADSTPTTGTVFGDVLFITGPTD